MTEMILTCVSCRAEYRVYVYQSDYEDWLDGKLAQDAFPYLSADEREMFISGICSDCWDRLFEEE